MRTHFLITVLVCFTALHCAKSGGYGSEDNKGALEAAYLVALSTAGGYTGGTAGSLCSTNSQCASGMKCINGTCGGQPYAGGSTALAGACVYNSSFYPNTCQNSTCGTTNFCGGRGAGCTANSECGTGISNPGCAPISCTSTSCTQLCGGASAACTTNGQCVNGSCTGGVCN